MEQLLFGIPIGPEILIILIIFGIMMAFTIAAVGALLYVLSD